MNELELPVYSVTQINAIIKNALEVSVGFAAVQGEITGFRVTKDRLVYFELKDKQSRILCFMMVWDLREQLQDGMEVKVYGTPSVFVKSGGMHFRVHQVELVGEGALKRAFEAMRKKLEAEGLFATERKRALPQFPEKVGLITSRDGAALTDITRVLSNRWGGLQIYVYPCGVQGYGAAESIARGFSYFNTHEHVDVIIVARGGGSLEDLQAFNTEIVARAIFGSRAPVISGVGHERDVTIADFVADVRAATPSNAAELCVPDRAVLSHQIETLARYMHKIIEDRVAEYHHGIIAALATCSRPIKEIKQALDRMITVLVKSGSSIVEHAGRRLKETDRVLASLNPRTVLKRGYSIVRKHGTIIHNVGGLAIGDEVAVELHEGSFKSSISEIV